MQYVKLKIDGRRFHLVATTTLANFNPRKFRHNLVIGKLRLPLKYFWNNKVDRGNYIVQFHSKSASMEI